jgi:hypothetical protein
MNSPRLARRMLIAGAALSVLSFSGCSHAHSKVAVVNIAAIEQRWPKFINYYRQIQANYVAINDSKVSPAEKRRALAQWQQQSQRWQDEVSNDVRSVVKNIAGQQHYEMVVTRQGVAYGGDDITTDVEKALKIDTSSPAPSR